MELLRKRFIYLLRCRGINRMNVLRLLSHDPQLKRIYQLSPLELHQAFNLPLRQAAIFHKDLHDLSLQRSFQKDYESYSILTILDKEYPEILKHINDPPLVLYLKGDQSLLHNKPSLSVIGTRNPSREAKLKTKHFVKPLAKKRWVIVSGMARGIDSFAHFFSLKYEGPTIAVLGSGFHHIYPRENLKLYEEIVKNGLVISEYPPNFPPKKYQFPERNRIISALSFGTLVIEAKRKSGTLITVDQALDQGREVYAAPGSLFSPQTEGCHKMIQEGARLIMNAEEIIEDWESIGYHLFHI